MAERFASVSEDELCEKCIIKQLLNSVFAWYHELSKPCVCVICLSLRLLQITQTSVVIIHDIMLNLIQQLFNKYTNYNFRSIAAFCSARKDLKHLELASEPLFLMWAFMQFQSFIVLIVKVRPPSVFRLYLGHIRFMFDSLVAWLWISEFLTNRLFK